MEACHVCGHPNLETARYCADCGSRLAPAVSEREERKIVTILFCDLVESTARFDLADPEDVRETLATYHARVRREIERFGGTVEKFIGDAVMAVYGAPVAHEDDAQRALLSALRIPAAIEELNEANQDLPLEVRIGIETGEAFVTVGADQSRQGIALGDVVNTASRLQGVAPTSGIVVGEGSYRLTEELFEFEPLEPVRVKGKADPLRIWLVRAARSRFGDELQRRPSTPLVDREDELELLKRTFARTVREPSVQLVTLMGEPGVGKSRVIKEFFGYLDDQPELVVWRQGRCLPYGEGVTFWALSQIVKAHAGILESDGTAEADEKLGAAVRAVVREPAERDWIKGRLAPLIGLVDPQTESSERTEAFSAWRRFLESIAAVYPLVLVIEDLHWADPALLDFVEHVVDWSTGLPIFIVCTGRSELYERHPRWGGGKRNSSTVTLAPLAEADTIRLISTLFPPETPDEVQKLVLERVGGNPLFAEEFARMLNERPAESGEAPSVPRIPTIGRTPDSLQAIIAARLDTLPADQKSLLQDASVVGRVFWAGALAAVGHVEPQTVRTVLHELTQRELVRPSRFSSVENETEYSFWHTLIRDVTYAQIPRARRAHRHIAAARWLEQMAGERVSDQAELLAHHYGQAATLARSSGLSNELAALEDATRRYWILAGERAMNLDASRAEQCFEQALRLIPEGHSDRAMVLSRRAEAAFDAGRYEEASRHYEDAVGEFQRHGNPIGAGASMSHLASALWEFGDTAGCRASLARAVEILEGQPPGQELADCFTSIASDRLLTGHFKEAVEWSDRSIDLASTLRADHIVPRALSYRGVSRCYLGDLGGLEDLERALDIADELGLWKARARVLVILAEVLWATDGPARALEMVETGVDLAERRGLVDMAVGCRTISLGPLFDQGSWDEVLRVADDVIRRSEEAGGAYAASMSRPWKAQVLLWRGEAAQAASLSSDHVSTAREIRDPQVLVPTFVAAALVATDQSRHAEAVELVVELDRIADVRIDWYREQFIGDLVRICVAGDELGLARRLLEQSEAFTLRHRLSLDAARAVLHEAIGELDTAAQIYEEVVDRWREYGNVFEAGLAMLGVGRVLGRLEHRERAQARLADARSVFERLEAKGLVAAADAHIGTLLERRG